MLHTSHTLSDPHSYLMKMQLLGTELLSPDFILSLYFPQDHTVNAFALLVSKV